MTYRVRLLPCILLLASCGSTSGGPSDTEGGDSSTADDSPSSSTSDLPATSNATNESDTDPVDTTADPTSDPTSDTTGEPCGGGGGGGSGESTGGSGSGDDECGPDAICVTDECVPIPFPPIEDCGGPLGYQLQLIDVPLGRVVGADYDDDGTDELWGYNFGTDAIEVYALDGTQLAALEVGDSMFVNLVAVRVEDGPDSIALIRPSDMETHEVVHVWRSGDGLTSSSAGPRPQRLHNDVFARDFDGDGTVELVVGFGSDGIDLWSISPQSQPAFVAELEEPGWRAEMMPFPDGGGLGLLTGGSGPLEYYALSADGFELVDTRDPVDGLPAGYGAFLDSEVILPAMTGGVAFAEFDAIGSMGLGTYEGNELQMTNEYRAPIDQIIRVLGTDLDGDGRDEALVLDWEEGVIVRYDDEGVPCRSAAEIDADGGLLDIDGDGRMEFAQPGGGVTILSAP